MAHANLTTAAQFPLNRRSRRRNVVVVAAAPIAVRFDANVAKGLPWRFTPPKAVEVRIGEEQLLMPGESKEFPVTFFVDPAIADDPGTADVTSITLSCTLFNQGVTARDVYLRKHGLPFVPDGSGNRE